MSQGYIDIAEDSGDGLLSSSLYHNRFLKKLLAFTGLYIPTPGWKYALYRRVLVVYLVIAPFLAQLYPLVFAEMERTIFSFTLLVGLLMLKHLLEYRYFSRYLASQSFQRYQQEDSVSVPFKPFLFWGLVSVCLQGVFMIVRQMVSRSVLSHEHPILPWVFHIEAIFFLLLTTSVTVLSTVTFSSMFKTVSHKLRQLDNHIRAAPYMTTSLANNCLTEYNDIVWLGRDVGRATAGLVVSNVFLSSMASLSVILFLISNIDISFSFAFLYLTPSFFAFAMAVYVIVVGTDINEAFEEVREAICSLLVSEEAVSEEAPASDELATKLSLLLQNKPIALQLYGLRITRSLVSAFVYVLLSVFVVAAQVRMSSQKSWPFLPDNP